MSIVPLAAKNADKAPTAEQPKNASEITIDRTASGAIDYTQVKFVNITAGSYPGYGQIHTGMEDHSKAPGYFVLRPDIPSKQDGGGAGRDNITQGHHIGTTQNYEDPDLGKLNG